MIPTYIICLERSRAKRCDPTFRAWENVSKEHNLDVRRLTAITPVDFQLKDVVQPYAYSCIQRKERKTLEMIGNVVEVACAMSHIKAWKRIVQDQTPGIVVEDDMALSAHKLNRMLSQLRTIPKDTDMYLLHFIGVNLKAKKVQSGFLDVSSFAGLQAYYMTPSCAQKLLRQVLPMAFQIDTYVPRAKEMYNLRIYTRPENRMSFFKFARDNLASTLGGSHVTSSMLTLVISIAVLVLVLIALIIICIVKNNQYQTCKHQSPSTSLRLKAQN
jgi:GR25 family glycosyltransferase involved in LPS biosynthesis